MELKHFWNIRILFTILLIVFMGAAVSFLVSPGRVAEVSAQDEIVWCFETIQHADGSIGYMGHKPPAQKVRPEKGDRHIASKCFSSWAVAASYITRGAVQLPADATEQDYNQVTKDYFIGVGNQ